jgi:hypothetical protein
MFKYIDFRVFLLSLLVGLLYIYVAEEHKKSVIVYPTPDNINENQYKDKSNNCFSYNLKEVKCPLDDNLLHSIKIQN